MSSRLLPFPTTVPMLAALHARHAISYAVIVCGNLSASAAAAATSSQSNEEREGRGRQAGRQAGGRQAELKL